MAEAWQNIIADFIRNFFNKSGLMYSEYDRIDDWLISFFNFKLKFIPRRPWQLRVSKEISKKLSAHPAKEHCFDIFMKASNGENLNPYQGKGLRNVNFHDDLFNDWGMHHLHLNSNKKNSANFFTDRSGDLLIVRFEDDIAYFIDIVKHKEENVWSLTNFIRIIQQNWPKILAKYEIGRVMTPHFDDRDIGILRKKGYSFAINVDGKSYFTLNHGYMSSGHNAMAIHCAHEVIRWGHASRDLANNNKSAFIEALKVELGLS